MPQTLIFLEKNLDYKGDTGLELLSQAGQQVFIDNLLCAKIHARHWHMVTKA